MNADKRSHGLHG